MPARLEYHGTLAEDLAQAAVSVKAGGARVVRDSARDGNRIAKDFARRSAGAHGKHYHKAFFAARLGALAYEYGPVAGMRQGGMSFERGSRNQPPHNDLAKSLDLIRPWFHIGVSDMLDDAFSGW